ncbi:RagB/SusD family nutrient uptake outer membrane protein [Pontibacter sp. G13]|uniref:RagB/SusD family nutrient uptake outer membrane protein n=1 Tax=Pontibacter sp. G13 TaxID=3074898 RepID=UPI0028897923|nr:RagB/SusD family nutrient uptake outer membrane protein [Pontibacter sp. G13]WNJ20434.1 RagB/SusD family nutrient uptake outer membrane protein [Pontibacter sp. G13]
MKKYKAYMLRMTLAVALLVSVQSCVDLMEDTSSVLSIENLKSEGDVVSALAPVYRQMATVYATPHFQRVPTYGADDLTTWWAGNKAPIRVFDRFDYGNGENSDINWLPTGWNGYWQVIYRANTVIDGLKTSTAAEDIVIAADGEARFLRALAYFHLVRTHGNMPIILDGYTPTGEETRATVLQNYEHIEADLLAAEAQLPGPGEVSSVGRISAAAAKTLLADLYLTWAGWPVKDNSKYAMAASKAKEVIDMGYFELLPIEDLWLMEGQNSRESVFSIQFSMAEDIRNGYPAAFSFHEARGWSDAYPELQFFMDFPEGPRKDATFHTEIPQRGVSGGQIVTKDPATLPWQDSQRGHPMYKKFTIAEDLTLGGRTDGYRSVEVYRYAEVLLIYAEAQAHAGSTGESIEALNQVRRRAAGIDYLSPDAQVDVVSATPNEVVDEKGWELAGEYKRWFDLIRTERVEEMAAKRSLDEQVELARQPTKDNYIAPIPFQAISTSELKQNPEGFVIQ